MSAAHTVPHLRTNFLGGDYPVGPVAVCRHFWKNRGLIVRLTRREVTARYKGSYLGGLWSVLTPLLLLTIYTFVFSVVFKARWGITQDETRGFFAITLYCGLIPLNLFSEVAGAAPQLITSQPNYVTKIVFPVELLPLVRVLSCVVNMLPQLIVLLVGTAWVQGSVPPTALLLPVALCPIVFFTLGVAYFLACLGVFLRDIGHTVGLVILVMTFLSPIFYPVAALPETFRGFAMTNPIARVVEASRRVTVFGQMPDWAGFAITLASALAVAWLGYLMFMRSKKAFADVL